MSARQKSRGDSVSGGRGTLDSLARYIELSNGLNETGVQKSDEVNALSLALSLEKPNERKRPRQKPLKRVLEKQQDKQKPKASQTGKRVPVDSPSPEPPPKKKRGRPRKNPISPPPQQQSPLEPSSLQGKSRPKTASQRLPVEKTRQNIAKRGRPRKTPAAPKMVVSPTPQQQSPLVPSSFQRKSRPKTASPHLPVEELREELNSQEGFSTPFQTQEQHRSEAMTGLVSPEERASSPVRWEDEEYHPNFIQGHSRPLWYPDRIQGPQPSTSHLVLQQREAKKTISMDEYAEKILILRVMRLRSTPELQKMYSNAETNYRLRKEGHPLPVNPELKRISDSALFAMCSDFKDLLFSDLGYYITEPQDLELIKTILEEASLRLRRMHAMSQLEIIITST